jgi:hypothetical protein
MMYRLRWSSYGLVEVRRQWVGLMVSLGDSCLSDAGNFMLSLELRSLRNSDVTVIGASQPVNMDSH